MLKRQVEPTPLEKKIKRRRAVLAALFALFTVTSLFLVAYVAISSQRALAERQPALPRLSMGGEPIAYGLVVRLPLRDLLSEELRLLHGVATDSAASDPSVVLGVARPDPDGPSVLYGALALSALDRGSDPQPLVDAVRDQLRQRFLRELTLAATTVQAEQGFFFRLTVSGESIGWREELDRLAPQRLPAMRRAFVLGDAAGLAHGLHPAPAAAPHQIFFAPPDEAGRIRSTAVEVSGRLIDASAIDLATLLQSGFKPKPSPTP